MKRFSKLVIIIAFAAGIALVVRHPLFKYSGLYIFDSSDSQLREIVDRNISGKKGSFAIVIKGLWSDTAAHYELNAQDIYPSASLYKLFLMAAVLDQVEQGKLKEEDLLKVESAHIAKIIQEDDPHKGTLEYTVGEALNRVAYFSDNYAAIMLAEKVGWDNIQLQVTKIGATATNIKEPITTNASDIALYFEKLYKGEIVSKKASDSIIERLSKAEVNDRIPANLPKDIKISHKTGELPNVRHDAGIVFLEGKPYLIVLMSKDLQYEDDGIEILVNISKEVFEYIRSMGR